MLSNVIGCQKGSRDCTYPESRTTSKGTSASKGDPSRSTAINSGARSDDDDSIDQFFSLGSGGQESKPETPSSKSSKSSKRSRASRTTTISSPRRPTSPVEQPQPPHEQVRRESCRSPSSETSSTPTSAGLEKNLKFSPVSTEAFHEDGTWSHLPQDLQFYLDYHKQHLTSHHYFFKHEANHFLHTILVEHALRYDPLLFALVGFAAFQMTVTRPNGKIQDFLGYYNKSVSLLRKSLRGNEQHTEATMLTILQLATFEVCQFSRFQNSTDHV